MHDSLKELIADLQSKDAGQRAAAAAALGSMGAKAQEALPFLFAAMEDCDEAVQRQARVALGRITSPPCI